MFPLFVPLALQTGPHPRLWLAHVRKTFQHRNHNPPPTILLSSFMHFLQHLMEPWLIALIKEIELCPNKSLHNWFLILIQKLTKKKERNHADVHEFSEKQKRIGGDWRRGKSRSVESGSAAAGHYGIFLIVVRLTLMPFNGWYIMSCGFNSRIMPNLLFYLFIHVFILQWLWITLNNRGRESDSQQVCDWKGCGWWKKNKQTWRLFWHAANSLK